MEGERYTSGNRAACAFISLAFVYSTVFSAIFENSIPYESNPPSVKFLCQILTTLSAGNDIAALLPKYISIKRGFFICAGKKGRKELEESHLPQQKTNKRTSPFLCNLSLVPPRISLNLYHISLLLPDLPISNYRNSHLRLLSHPPRATQHSSPIRLTPKPVSVLPWIQPARLLGLHYCYCAELLRVSSPDGRQGPSRYPAILLCRLPHWSDSFICCLLLVMFGFRPG